MGEKNLEVGAMLRPVGVYREFFMDTMQMVVAIPWCFGSFSFVIMDLYITEWCPVVLGQLGRR